MWRWLESQESPLELRPPLNARPVEALRLSSGALRVSFGGGHELALEPVFAPAAWGEAAANIGTDLVVAASSAGAFLSMVAAQLEQPPPALSEVRETTRVLIELVVSRARDGFEANIVLVNVEKPRVRLLMDLGLPSLAKGTGWIAFRGPRGKKSRALVLDLIAQGMSPEAP
jgi:hypothetical protein